MTPNPYQSPQEPAISPAGRPARKPRSFLGAVGLGCLIGLKWTTFIIGPVAVLMLLAVLALGAALIANGEPDSWNWLLDGIVGAFGVYLSSCFWGAIAGIVVGPLCYLFGWREKASSAE